MDDLLFLREADIKEGHTPSSQYNFYITSHSFSGFGMEYKQAFKVPILCHIPP